MIIGVDAGALGTKDQRLKAGVYYASYFLLKELKRLDTNNTYYLYSFTPLSKKLLSEFPKKSKNIVVPSKAWMYFSLPLQFLFKKPDVFLALSQAMPAFHPFKTIGFVHGLDFSKKFHEYGNNLKKLQKYTKYLCENADVLITTSEFLKKSIKKSYATKRIVTAPLGVDKEFEKVVKQHKEKHPYFLFVGSIKPSKNLPSLLLAFKQFLKDIKRPYFLLCIGSTYWIDSSIEKLIQDLGLKEYVVFKDAMAQNELLTYYKGALAFVSPSLYEGFGMTFLEAMSAGCPIIGSAVGGIPEVVDHSGVLVDPRSKVALAKAMKKIATDKKAREFYKNAGKKQVLKFTWEKHARLVFQEIQNI